MVVVMIMIIKTKVKDDVVMRVTIVRDQHTSIVVASKFDGVKIDLVHGSEERLSIVLDHNSARVNGRGSELRVNIFANFNISTDLFEDHTMAARVRVLYGCLFLLRLGRLRVQLGNGWAKWEIMRMVVVMIVVVMIVVMVVVVEVVVLKVMVIFLGDNNVIMRVAIVRDQDTAVIVASKLDSVGINLVDRGEDSLAIMLDYDFGGAYSGSRELRIDVIREIDMATDLVELDSMRAERRLLLLLAVVMRVIVGMVKDSWAVGVVVAVVMVMVSMLVAVAISIVLVEVRIFRVIRDSWAVGVVVAVVMVSMLVAVAISIMVMEVRILWAVGVVVWVIVWVIMRVVMNVKVTWVIMRMVVGVVMRVVMVMGMIMIVIVVIMGTLHALDNNIIMRITIVRNEYTSVIIASELDSIRVDLRHGGNNSLTICLKDGSGLGDSSCSKLRVSAWVSCRISSNNVKFNAM